jgi:hypothetical protein
MSGSDIGETQSMRDRHEWGGTLSESHEAARKTSGAFQHPRAIDPKRIVADFPRQRVNISFHRHRIAPWAAAFFHFILFSVS